MGFPTSSTVFRWSEEDEKFRKDYDVACRIRAERFAEELVALADIAKDAQTPEKVQAIKSMVNTRQWVCSRLLNPYHDQPGWGNNINVNVTNNSLVISETQRQELMEQIQRLEDSE